MLIMQDAIWNVSILMLLLIYPVFLGQFRLIMDMFGGHDCFILE